MDIKLFYKYFTKFAYKKYVCLGIVLLFLRYGLGVEIFDFDANFSIFLALLIYDLPPYLKFKHWENNKIYRYRDLIEIFTSIISVLNLAYRGFWTSEFASVGYYDLELFEQQCSRLFNRANQKQNVNFNVVKYSSKDFQALQYIHASFFEKYCLNEKSRDNFLVFASNITKLERDANLILNSRPSDEQLNCIDNFHLQVLNICSGMEFFYKSFFDEVEANIPVNRERYFTTMFGD